LGKTPKPGNGGNAVTFRATIPPIETAIKVHGDGGARLLLDIAETDLGAFLPILPMRSHPLMITIARY